MKPEEGSVLPPACVEGVLWLSPRERFLSAADEAISLWSQVSGNQGALEKTDAIVRRARCR